MEVFAEEFDPANRSLADALHRSFQVLKLLMLVLLTLYLLSGLTRIEQSEVGLKLRLGRIVGTGAGEQTQVAVHEPGWYFAWPYPIEGWLTVPGPAAERKIPVDFMFLLTKEEKATGIKGYKQGGTLSPLRDDYLITGDANIIHASMWVKYRITDAVAYVSNVYPMPDPKADVMSKEYRRYPEYTILRNLVRDSAIETAAARRALKIRGEEQDAFLYAVADRLNDKLKELDRLGRPLGITIDPATGIIGRKLAGIEPIMPPRQVQEEFDKVQAADSHKSQAITLAQAEAQALLVNTAGPDHALLASAIEGEFELMLELSAAESGSASGGSGGDGEVARLRPMLDERRSQTEAQLRSASGEVRHILQNAEIAKDAIVKEAKSDYEVFIKMRPQYLRNPVIFMSRLLDETYARALDSEGVSKVYVPQDCLEHRLQIYRADKIVSQSKKEKERKPQMGAKPKFR